MRLDGRVALVTVASSGKAAATAARLAEEGARIFAAPRCWLAHRDAAFVTGRVRTVDGGATAHPDLP